MNDSLISALVAVVPLAVGYLVYLGTRGANKNARDKGAIEGYGELVDDLREEVARVKADNAELHRDRASAREDKAAIEARLKAVMEENVTLHETNVALTAARQAPPPRKRTR